MLKGITLHHIRLFGVIIIWIGICDCRAESISLSKKFPYDVLEQIISQPTDFHPIPTASEDFWRNNLPVKIREEYIRQGLQYSKKNNWIVISPSTFSEYRRNGNRSNYEQQNYIKRRQFACLVMAEIMEGKKNYVEDILNGLDYFFSEVWWGLPAHYPDSLPKRGNQVVDLYNAETAALIAWSIYMLGETLEGNRPGICQLARDEINRRILVPSLTTNFAWKKRTNNWNPWICSNWLTCILLCETDRDRQLRGIGQILTCLDLFYNSYPEDGGCDEGIMYWSRAAGSLFDCLQLLDIASNGVITLANDKKLMNMADYIQKLHIDKDYFVNYADSRPNSTLSIHTIYPFGKYINNPSLMDFCCRLSSIYGIKEHPAKQFNSAYPELGRELLFLTNYPTFKESEVKEPAILDRWLPNLQVVCSRSTTEPSSGLFLSVKGGHNDESHNHNDIGNFIVYADGEPIIIDIGGGTYTAQTFSKQRYELFNCRSAYHNVPLINGYEQHEGKNYMATDVKYKNDEKQSTLTLDISEAYPKEAYVSKWKRTVQLNRGKEVLITEEYKLKKYKQPSEIVLICCGKAQLEGSNKIVINNGKSKGAISFNANQLSPSIEKINYQDNAILNAWQKRSLYRIRLSLRNESLKGTISYSIKQE